MSTESPRRRIRRAQQPRRVSHPVLAPAPDVAPGLGLPGADDASRPLPAAETVAEIDARPAAVAPVSGDESPDPVWPDDRVASLAPVTDLAASGPRDPGEATRDGAWLPAGITLLVVAGLLLCAGLVLIASRQ